MCYINKLALPCLANKDRMRSGDDSQLLVVHRYNEMPDLLVSFDTNVVPIIHLLYKSALQDQQ